MRLQTLMMAASLGFFLSPAYGADDVRLFAPVPQAAVTLPSSTSGSFRVAPDMRGLQQEAGPAALMAGTDARWPAAVAAAEKETAAAPAEWQVAAQSRLATTAPRSLVSPNATQAWQVAPQASAPAR